MKKFLSICFAVLVCSATQVFAQTRTNALVSIVKAEDERRFDKTLEDLMKIAGEKLRIRAALAAGRIGDERAIPALINLLGTGSSGELRTMAAFALGEIESIKAADTILNYLKNEKIAPELQARFTEAAGKIAAANPKDSKTAELGKAILDVLEAETKKPQQNRLTVLLGLTAILRAKPESGDLTAAKFLTNLDGRIRADAANTLSRLRAKNANEQLRAMLLADDDANARANAARALGAAEDKLAFDLLLEAAASDEDSRVRASAIRSLGNLKDAKAADRLLMRGEKLSTDYKQSKFASPIEKNELLEIATTLGRILPNSNNKRAVKFLDDFRLADDYESAEIEIALALVAPAFYLKTPDRAAGKGTAWKQISSLSQGVGEFSKLTDKGQSIDPSEIPEQGLLTILNAAVSPKAIPDAPLAVPDILRAYATFKSNDLQSVLRELLKNKDIIIRATAAELLGEQSANKENVEALKTAFTKSLETDKQYNDAQLAILSTLVKLDKAQAISSLNLALDAPDYLVRRHAAQLIKQNDLTIDFPNAEAKVGTLKLYNAKTNTKLGQILNTDADYARAVSRRSARAILTTDKGTFNIEFFPEDAPLTVDNFIKLARANYFNGLAIHRVVPNFVMQDGDPRGDGNGGPGWQIRCEINVREYERGAVGMALSGKDTGGSQWFVTHAPQPHLDGGYTVFGRVNETDMRIVDRLVRGDKIRSVKIVENNVVTPTINNKRRAKAKR